MSNEEAIRQLKSKAFEDYSASCYYEAISALEKQIPKKPKITIHNGFCPNCENAFGREWVLDAMVMPKWKSFCPVCGQAIDWGDSNGR